LKNNGTIRLNVRDMFAGGVFKGYSKYSNVDVQFRNVNDSRAGSLSFTWRFNKGKSNAAGQRKRGGAEDEQNRVKGGN
jgi:iron complex outermembrane receptor protein